MLRAGLVSGDRRRAVVLVAVDATVKNVKAPDGRPSHYRIQVDLVRDRDSGRLAGVPPAVRRLREEDPCVP